MKTTIVMIALMLLLFCTTYGQTLSFTQTCFVDSITGWIVGYQGLIHKTTTGGNTWVDQSVNSTNNLYKVFFVNKTIGWICGANGTILKTSDGGATWTLQNSSVTVNLFSIYFIDSNNGWTCSSDSGGIILSTTNGGMNWIMQSGGSGSSFASIKFVDTNHGWAVGPGGTIIHTINGGNKWTIQTSNTTVTLWSVDFVDTLQGWAAGGDYTVNNTSVLLKTTDGGTTWIPQSLYNGMPFFNVDFINKSIGWVSGRGGTIFKTTDGGKNWINQSYDGLWLGSMSFVNENYGWLSDGAGNVLRTTNGATWTLLNANNINHLPIANAGPDKTVKLINASSVQIVLDGSASSDPDGDSLTFVWKENTTILGTTVQPKVILSIGKHIIALTVNDGNGGTSSDTVIINIVTAPPFSILSIQDVPNDQGKQVEIVWRNFEKDTTVPFIVSSYNVWRNDAGVWTHVWEVPSRKDSILSVVVPTLYDFTLTNGIHWSVFQITAHGSGPSQIAYTSVDSGYSIDNLAPSVPSGIVGGIQGNAVVFNWKPSLDQDFRYFAAVYRSMVKGFNPKGMIPYQTVTDPKFIDTGIEKWSMYYYRISAFDFSGNESPYSSEISASVSTGVKLELEVPKEFELSQNFPNPFNPTTEITFFIPSNEFVSLKVYDLLGREVATLMNNQINHGTYSVTFDASKLASGLYIYRLQAGSFIQTKKMLLMK